MMLVPDIGPKNTIVISRGTVINLPILEEALNRLREHGTVMIICEDKSEFVPSLAQVIFR